MRPLCMPVSPLSPAPRITGLGDGFLTRCRQRAFRGTSCAFATNAGQSASGWVTSIRPSGRLISLGSSSSRRTSRNRWRCATTDTRFRRVNPSLGDGRGFLFAQLEDDAGRLLDLGTKGSGKTPWSRGADGLPAQRRRT